MALATQESQQEILDALDSPALPTGAATAAKQDTGNTSLASIDGKLPAKGVTTPAGSVSVTGSIVTSQSSLDDVTASGTATAFASLAAGPGGILVQNTSASGGANVRIDGAPTATHGVQLAPGEKWVFAVDNANRLKHYAESGSPTVSAAQA